MSAGVYLHIPFCKSRCSYCDFATDVYTNSDAVKRYVRALRAEVSAWRPVESGTQNADTIYFGGGTPSLLSVEQVGQILTAVRRKFDVAADAEVTMEMNPATVTPETLAGYRSLGVNRASFGVQTFNECHLKLLARGHSADDARNTFKLLRNAGFDNTSFDLIIGLPGQTLEDWENNLDHALAMEPEHLSLYLLEIHEGTPLAVQLKSGRRPMPDEQLAAEMYELMQKRVDASLFVQYEISNFAKPGYESKHNSKYWRLEPVYGFGVSAHSFDGRQRYANDRDTARYSAAIEGGSTAEVFREDILAESEFIFLGLRLSAGIALSEYRDRFGEDLEEKYRNELSELLAAGFLATI